MSAVITTSNTTASTALTTVGLLLASTMVIAACAIGLYMKRKCTSSSLQPTTVRNLNTALWVGIGVAGIIILGSLLYAVMSRPK